MHHAEFSCRVTTRFLPEQSDPAANVYAFAYTVTIRNTGDTAAQLIARHWHIADATGRSEDVRGLGVVGQQPLIRPGEQFEYSSWTRLAAPRGRMEGTFYCMTDEAESVEAAVPPFDLATGQALH